VRIRSVLSHSTQALIEGALISLLVVGLMAGSAFAAKPTSSGGGGSHKGGGSGSAGTATLVVSPDPVAANSDFRVSGCGYKPGGGVQLNLYAPGTTSVWAVTADSAGCLPLGYGWAPGVTGTATLKALAGSVTVVASTTFQIN
jgi:hypothetical protein